MQGNGERIAVVDGIRSPFAKGWTSLKDLGPVELSTAVARELIFRNELDPENLDQIVWGTVISVVRSPNVAREVALNLGLYRTPGYSLTRACATGLQCIASAADMIWAGSADVVLAGGVDMASSAPVLHKKKVIDVLQKARKQSGLGLARTLAGINPADLFPSPPKLTEPYTGKTMGEHAEEMAQYFQIPREVQENFSMESHRKASEAIQQGLLAGQVAPVRTRSGIVGSDNLVREQMRPEKLASMRPVFDRKHGTITAATSSALTDGAACVLLMRESRAKELGHTPLGYLRSYSFSAHDPRENMLLGNVYSVPKALERAGLSPSDVDLWEIHEAFAAQVLCNLACFDDGEFFREKLGIGESFGEIDPSKINIWGGSLAYGHPFAATGFRLVTGLLHALRHTDGNAGVATACAAGGLGSAMVLERA
jgi:acetyl-CoA acyltransferase